MNDCKGSSVVHSLDPSSEKVYYLESKEMQNFIKIKLDASTDSSPWSSPFLIDNLTDFMLALNVGSEEVKYEETEEIKTSTDDWYLPSKSNNYTRYVRVIISTKDNATIFITIVDPFNPEIMVKNSSNKEIEFRQKDGKNVIKLPPDTTAPFVWEIFSEDNKMIALK